MDDFELDQDEPFSPVKVLIVGSLMLVFGLCLVSYPAYRVLSSGSDSGAATPENARPFTCIGCEPTQWKLDGDPPTAPVRPAPNGTGTEAADAAPPSVASLAADGGVDDAHPRWRDCVRGAGHRDDGARHHDEPSGDAGRVGASRARVDRATHRAADDRACACARADAHRAAAGTQTRPAPRPPARPPEGEMTTARGHRTRSRRTPNHASTAPPTTNFTATIQSVTSRPVWLSSVTMLDGSVRS